MRSVRLMPVQCLFNKVLTIHTDVAKNTSLIKKDQRGMRQQLVDFRNYFGEWRHGIALFGACASWFLL